MKIACLLHLEKKGLLEVCGMYMQRKRKRLLSAAHRKNRCDWRFLNFVTAFVTGLTTLVELRIWTDEVPKTQLTALKIQERCMHLQIAI